MGIRFFLVEPILKHVKQAKKRANKLNKKFTVQIGEARNLAFPNNFANMIILHGPLYRLQDKKDREKAILEAKRVLKKGGVILGFAINYMASTLVGLLQGLIHEKAFFTMCKEELTTGKHYPPERFPRFLAEAYYHKPEELKEEFINQKLEFLNMYAVEGLIWLDRNYFKNMFHKQRRKTLNKLLKITEQDINLMSFSPHMMIAARK